ncbi:hypothetical protein DPEC_G00176700 [Dallia pectoralis]|uniref:Uncharacterized protein n=1 Tax=Dallia pectoralis TaxID=75939 RepID=A0ACC2GF18_DALPE|nr:hypothetical protein DPEC_G00176700 [Dallia pectoralis]
MISPGSLLNSKFMLEKEFMLPRPPSQRCRSNQERDVNRLFKRLNPRRSATDTPATLKAVTLSFKLKRKGLTKGMRDTIYGLSVSFLAAYFKDRVLSEKTAKRAAAATGTERELHKKNNFINKV